MSEAFEIARRMANVSPLAVAALHTESDRLAYLDSQDVKGPGPYWATLRRNVSDELELEAARLRSQETQYRGAPMGQPTTGAPAAAPIRYRLSRVPLNSGGYDRSGTYWGLGAPLYSFDATEGDHSGHVRARSRELAKVEVRKFAPAAAFYGKREG